MRGHDKIIQVRMDGKAPAFVFINDYPCQTDWFEHNDHATICVHKDWIRTLDLRFLVGLSVSISASTEARAKDLRDACLAAGALRVAVCHVKPEIAPWRQDGYAEVAYA